MNGEENNNTLMVIAVIAVVVSAVAFFFVSSGLVSVSRVMLAPNGTTSVDIVQNVRVDFRQSTIDFGTGYVDPGTGFAQVSSSESGNALNWLDANALPIVNPASGFVVENIGNVNVDLSIYTNDTVDNWLSTTGLASLEYMVRDCTGVLDCTVGGSADNDNGPACTAGADLPNGMKGVYNPVNETIVNSASVCNPFFSGTLNNEIRIDLNLTLTEGILPTSGQRNMQLVADIVAV